jgi:hypothetical protein
MSRSATSIGGNKAKKNSVKRGDKNEFTAIDSSLWLRGCSLKDQNQNASALFPKQRVLSISA